MVLVLGKAEAGCSKPVGTIGVLFGVLVIIVQTLPGSRPVTAGASSLRIYLG